MKMDVLDHLDRAFTQAPPELAASVEEAFERGAKAVKQRHKIMTAAFVAAAIAVLCAAMALAAGTVLRPRVDNVVASRGSGQGEGARLAGPTPLPEKEAAFDLDDATVYYATQDGVYFHLNEHCSGMRNAWPLNLDVAWVCGKEPCPVCVDETRVPRLWLYYTDQGKYYHIYSDCSGMKDSQRASPSVCLSSGIKQPCPVCIPEGSFDLCWATPMGQYFHSERECMGMHNARLYTRLYCARLGKQPCPLCASEEADSAGIAALGGLQPVRRETLASARTEPAAAASTPMTVQKAWEKLVDADPMAGKSGNVWLYLSSEANAAWAFYATNHDERKLRWTGAAWFISDQACVCLGRSDSVESWDFFTQQPQPNPMASEGGGSYIAYGREVFASRIQKGKATTVHLWMVGEDGLPMELEMGNGLSAVESWGGILAGKRDRNDDDWVFLYTHDQLYQITAQQAGIGEVETLPGAGDIIGELQRAGYTVTDCLYRNMDGNINGAGAAVITVNLEQDGQPCHTYMMRKSWEDAFTVMRGWEDDIEVHTGKGTFNPDAGLPALPSSTLRTDWKVFG